MFFFAPNPSSVVKKRKGKKCGEIVRCRKKKVSKPGYTLPVSARRRFKAEFHRPSIQEKKKHPLMHISQKYNM
jgi:hypothetical protein